MADVAREIGVPLFIDGARLFNASVALGVPARELVPPGASATFCLSKSLGCPVGSVVVGDAAFIWRARRARKMVGGGMRQAGIIAAAGVVALQDGPDGMIERLADDHANARYLADALASMPGVRRLDPARVRTNFVLFGVGDDEDWPDDAAGRARVLATRAAFLGELHDRGVRMIEYPKGLIRAIPHYGIERADIDTAIAASRAALAAIGLAPAVSRSDSSGSGSALPRASVAAALEASADRARDPVDPERRDLWPEDEQQHAAADDDRAGQHERDQPARSFGDEPAGQRTERHQAPVQQREQRGDPAAQAGRRERLDERQARRPVDREAALRDADGDGRQDERRPTARR